MKKIFLLGSSSFIGKNIYPELRSNFETVSLSRPQFDFLDPKTYISIDFSNSIIVDCINVNNGNTEEINKCNIEGFIGFLDFLKDKHSNTKYLYFSTISVISDEICKANAYVNSKKIAEEYLKNSGLLYHIVRLSFPIGKGENEMRLTTRLINSIKNKSELKLSDIKLNITPVNCIAEQITKLVSFNSNLITFFSNNKYTPLIDLVKAIESALGIKANYKLIEQNSHFEPLSNNPVGFDLNLDKLVSEMI